MPQPAVCPFCQTLIEGIKSLSLVSREDYPFELIPCKCQIGKIIPRVKVEDGVTYWNFRVDSMKVDLTEFREALNL